MLNGVMSMVTMVLTLALAGAYSAGGHISQTRQERCYLLMLLTLFSETFFSSVGFFLEGQAGAAPWIWGTGTITFVLGDIERALFFAFIRSYLPLPGKTDRALAGASLLSFLVFCLVMLANLFTGFVFGVGRDGWLIYPDTYFIMPVYYLLWVVLIAYQVLRHVPRDGETLVLLLRWSVGYLILIPLDLALDWVGYDTNSPWLYTILPFIGFFLIFCDVFVSHRLRLAREEQELTQSRLNAMVMQINPHFIHNTLGSIDAMIRTRPEEAHRLLLKFSRYLRDNYADMTALSLIRFSEEMEHLKHYLEIEQVRFPNLKVVFQTECDYFLLPRMTLQPLVENAVRHGIHPKPDSAGTVTVRSLEEEEAFVVLIEDDGVGFSSLPEDGGPHIGIANARTRLSMMCGGTLEVDSIPGKRTVCRIRIPKKGQRERNAE